MISKILLFWEYINKSEENGTMEKRYELSTKKLDKQISLFYNLLK